MLPVGIGWIENKGECCADPSSVEFLLVNGSSILLVVANPAKTGENPTYPYHAPNYTKLEVLVFSKYTSPPNPSLLLAL